MLWALHDSDPLVREERGACAVDRAEAERLNAEGWGIYWTPNLVRGRRTLTNLERIRFWFAELDHGSKKEQVERLRQAPLLPSVVVESARGFHAYWAAKDATLDRWKRIVRWGIVPTLQADPKASDAVRILRCPGFNHVKNPAKPFPVSVVWRLDTAYTEEQMLRKFPDRSPKDEPQEHREVLEPGDGSFWVRAAQLDGREALRRLSGHWCVRGEKFSLAEQPNGNANIIRQWPDGPKDTGSFVDKDGRLGSVEGGNSIAAWIHWYGHPWHVVAEALREVFPELGERDETFEEAKAAH